MEICCKKCRRDVHKTDVSLEFAWARCRACDTYFDISAEIREALPKKEPSSTDPVAASPPQRRREAVPLPKGWILERLGPDRPETGSAYRTPGRPESRELRLVLKGFGTIHLAGLFFSLALSAVVVDDCHLLLTEHDASPGSFFVPLFLGAVVVLVGYHSLQAVVNKRPPSPSPTAR